MFKLSAISNELNMIIDIEFVKDFEKYLQNHQNELKELYQKTVIKSYETGYYLGLDTYFTNKKPIRLEIESLIHFVENYFSKSIISYLNNIYGFKLDFQKKFEVDYNLNIREEVKEMYLDQEHFNKRCYNDFWKKNPQFESDFKIISQFEPLEKLTFQKDVAFGKFVSRDFKNIHVNNWIEYINRIFKYCLSDYEVDTKSDKNVFRIFRNINDEFNVGIEYPMNIAKSYFKKGSLSLDYISVVIFNNNFQRKSKGYNYGQISDENIFTLFDLEISTHLSHLPRLEGCFNSNYEYEIIEDGNESTLQAKYFNEDYVKRFCFMYFVTMLKVQEPIIDFFVEKFTNFVKERL